MTIRIAPSVLAADFGHLGREIERVAEAGADWIHIDVMDGHFVPNISFGMPIVRAIKHHTDRPLDVHLMVSEPDRYIGAFAAAGAASLSVHAEATADLGRSVRLIKSHGARAGVAVNPGTPVQTLASVARDLDIVVIMSVHPGFTGQAFLPQAIHKVGEARALLAGAGSKADIEVDGGVSRANARRLVEAGATVLVAGASVFHAEDAAWALRDLRQAATAP